MKKNYKKWVIIFNCIIIIFIVSVSLVNFITDQDHIFKNTFIDNCKVTGNERFSKFKYLDNNYSKYDSYLIGGSRIGVIRPEITNKHVANSHFYNLYMHICRLHESKLIINYIANNYIVKNIILQLSLNDLSQSGTVAPLHYKVTGENMFSFYCKYLFNFNIKNVYQHTISMYKKQKFDSQPLNCDGTWNFQQIEDSIAKSPYSFSDLNANFFNGKNVKLQNLTEKLHSLLEIKETCRKHNINLTICFIPENHSYLDMVDRTSYLNFIRELGQVTDFWNFSGYNTVTTNDTNYYDKLHFRYFIGDMMVAKMFNNTCNLPKDFGFYVTAQNIDSHLKYLEDHFRSLDQKEKVTLP